MSDASRVTARSRLLWDRAAALLISAVGLSIIALVLLILWYLLSVVTPLARSFEPGPPVTLAGDPAPLARRVHIAEGVGVLRVPDPRRGWTWELTGGAQYRCTPAGPLRSLEPPPAMPLRAATLAEADATLLLLDDRGALFRFAPRSESSCVLYPLGPGLDQDFPADAMLSERDRAVTLLVNTGTARLRALLTTTGEQLFDGVLPGVAAVSGLSMTTDGSALQGYSEGRALRWPIFNPSPEASLRALWQRVWYGGYDEPTHVWHPDGEGFGALSKYGLTPLLWGTFKAALYGMFIAVPVALGAAIYTGYFLPPRLRNRVKPTIELMEAFPTVVLGFVAGLWLAPLLSNYLLFLFLLPLLLFTVPLLLALAHLLAQRLSPRLRGGPPRIVPLALAYAVACAALLYWAPDLEQSLFGATLRDWLLEVAGVEYAQRNALLVGLAMGFALVPTLFSIVEDAIFAVPRALSDGSLALGATRWQTLARVVLPAASPALLSALLIALARGLGETMIVLLATGNTPIMEAGPFSGLRSLAASLAAELPEAAVNGTQFRVLFLASLVLFALTFALNTVAELFRQRLRYRYAGR